MITYYEYNEKRTALTADSVVLSPERKRKIDQLVLDYDSSHLAPINGRVNVAQIAIDKVTERIEASNRHYPALWYICELETLQSIRVNDPSNW